MNVWLMALVLVLTGVAVVATVVMLVRDESPPGDPYFLLLGLLLVVLLVQAVVGLVALAGTEAVDGPTFVAYLLTAVLVVPVGAALALVERSRWGTLVLLVALLTVAAMQVRLDSLWAGAGA